MRKNLKFISALLAVCTLCGFVSCSNSSDSNSDSSESSTGVRIDGGGDLPNDLSVSEDDMPYGATMTALLAESDDNVKISIEFDNRFFDPDENGNYPEMYLISDYFYSLNTSDSQLFKDVFYLPYLEYAVELTGYSDIDSYFNNYRDYLTENLGDGFEIDYLIIENLVTEADSPDSFTEMDEMLDKCSNEKISDKIDEGSRKLVYMEGTYTINGEGSYAFSYHLDEDVTLYLYTIDGQVYIV